MPRIVHELSPITLLGGGNVEQSDLIFANDYAPRLIAADGGADSAVSFGWFPETVIGDFDSLTEKTRQILGSQRLFQIAEQDSTDFDKCLRSIDAPLILGMGFTGRRHDHTLAAFSTLAARADKRCVLFAEEDLIFLAPPRISLDLPEGMRFSLYPLGPVRGTSEGLHWPIDGIPMAPNGRVGTSNKVSGPVRLTFDAPHMLILVPKEARDKILAALLEEPSKWPDPAVR
jgi:thiamine pyrophosphokinase